jgi:hypothetical protein
MMSQAKKQTSIKLSDVEVRSLKTHFGEKLEKCSAPVRSIIAVSLPSGVKRVQREVEEFRDFVKEGVDAVFGEEIQGLRPESSHEVRKETVKPVVAFSEVQRESNVQSLDDRRCPHALAGKKCGSGCVRCAQSEEALKPSSVRPEAILKPEDRSVDLDGIYKILIRIDGSWQKHGTCFGGPMGIYSARHVFYGDMSDLLTEIDNFRVETREGKRYAIDARTLKTPSTQQLAPGQVADFCVFRTIDPEFNKFVNEHRCYFRTYAGGEVRLMHWKDDSVYPVVESGKVHRRDDSTGMCRYDCNTRPSDSGSPVFSSSGHCIGVHHGWNSVASQNVFLLFYPGRIVSWFVQAEPLN